jgi:ABC-type uncharacterized transport system substrate-binding protein
MGEPVGDGLVTSLAQPGGNITGTTFLGPGLVPKRLELLKEALPKVTRIVALLHPGAFGERTMKDMVSDTEAAARTLNVQLQVVEVRGPDEFDRAFSTMARQHADALIVFDSVMLFSERSRIVALAAKRRLPAMFNNRESVEIGGLISYGVSLTDLWRRAATYVDKILLSGRLTCTNLHRRNGAIFEPSAEQSLAPYPGPQRVAMFPSVVRMLLTTFLEEVAKLPDGSPDTPRV